MPVFAEPEVADGLLLSSVESVGMKFEHLRAHLIMEFNPNEQIKAHKRTDNTITTLASKPLVPL